ncbi:peroxiredoxin [Roseisolibacter sp. H3M3-2]|uniref:peroxiredoxin family protein n=1 Tax=Roseisolibacter sp. H3M3-2 TaxID=3031323 RepID=UPI0023DA7785|nr:peroxiredoxin [Roseisolibacter sp. H3M3-2]MDF1501947.1 peroxiredoxin [Roseisolibacter sp. H3M3-2]
MTAPTESSAVPAVGTQAPDFTLPSTAGEKVTLSALRGRPVLLAFFPAAFTSVCTTEVCAFSDDYDAFQQKDLVVLPISVDLIPSLQEFKRKHDMKVDLLSDARRDVSRAYGVLVERTYTANRAYFLVDRDGTLRWVHVEEHGGFRRENAEILAEVAKLA